MSERVTVVCVLWKSYSGVCLESELPWCLSCGRVTVVCILRESYSGVCLVGEL